MKLIKRILAKNSNLKNIYQIQEFVKKTIISTKINDNILLEDDDIKRSIFQDILPIYFKNKETGEKFEWGEYKPLELQKVNEINGKLGNLLHPKDGLKLGFSNDKWYHDTRYYLNESIEYLSNILKDNHPFFAYTNLDQFELIKQ